MEHALHDSFQPNSEYRDLAADEMCSQFSKLFTHNKDKYWGEQALLNVLLNRLEAEGQENASLRHQLEHDYATDDDHLRRRAMIFLLLGLKSDAAQLVNSIPENLQAV